MADKTLTFALMDQPFENARSTTALRLIDIAIKKGYNVNVFAYEGAVYLPFALQSRTPIRCMAIPRSRTKITRCRENGFPR